MKNLIKVAAAGLVSFNFISLASAENGALKSAGFSLDEIGIPAVSAPAAAVGQAVPELDLFRYFGYPMSPKASDLSMNKGLKGAADTVFTTNLEAIKNAYLKPAIFFTTGAGTKVHISGSKASNCPNGGTSCKDSDKFFLVLTTSRKETYFVRAMDIVNYGILMSGSKTVTIDGEKYVVKAYAKPSAPETSKVEIKGPRGVALNSTLKDIGDGVASMGLDVKLGKTYKLAYGNEIVQGPQGAKFTDKMLVLMIPFPVVDASSYYIFPASDITPAGVTFPTFEKGFGFKLQGGVLDIYKL